MGAALATDEAKETRRRRDVEHGAATLRAYLAHGPASERELLRATRFTLDLLRGALGELAVRGEVGRTLNGYCLVPVLAS
jgi:hypothetical protein